MKTVKTYAIKEALAFLLKTNCADITTRQLSVLLACAGEQRTVRGVAVELGISKPVVTRAVNKLSKNGLMKRKDDPANKRSIFILLTPKGKKFAACFE